VIKDNMLIAVSNACLDPNNNTNKEEVRRQGPIDGAKDLFS